MAQTKATKKFEKSHLKDTLKRRNEFKKIKQKKQIKEKRKARRAKENGRADNEDAEMSAIQTKSGDDNKFADMSVDEFFQGGFDIPEAQGKSKSEAQQKRGKRKRSDAEGDSEGSAEAAQDAASSDESSDEGSGDDFEDHKQQLEALKSNDPEFYQHLKENEPELLDFADDADLTKIQLSESEDEEPKSKKQKISKKIGRSEDTDVLQTGASNEVTSAMVKKWHVAMTEKQSLRQTREVVLAFRAAVRSNDAEDKEYKYSISNPDGTARAPVHIASI